MRRPFRGDMPVPLTLPLHFDLNLAVRRRRSRRVALAALALLGTALLAAGFWLPAKAGEQAIARTAHMDSRALADVAIGDELTIERPDGTRSVYVVTGLDIVDSARAELGPDVDQGVVVLVTRWPFDAANVGGNWRYVVTARRTDTPGLSF